MTHRGGFLFEEIRPPHATVTEPKWTTSVVIGSHCRWHSFQGWFPQNHPLLPKTQYDPPGLPFTLVSPTSVTHTWIRFTCILENKAQFPWYLSKKNSNWILAQPHSTSKEPGKLPSFSKDLKYWICNNSIVVMSNLDHKCRTLKHLAHRTQMLAKIWRGSHPYLLAQITGL